MLRRVVAASRYIVAFAVASIALMATAIFVYGAVVAVRTVARPFRDGASGAGTKALLIGTIELVDLFLLGTTLYVIAIGLYELFIDPHLPTPAWLTIKNLDDLKAKVLAVVIVVLGVLFLGQVIAWDGQRDLLRLGGGIALVIAALTYFLGQKTRSGDDEKQG
jgi:uncharacterized membrane protein YqhA